MVAGLLQPRLRFERRSRPPPGRRGGHAARQGDPQDPLPRRRRGMARRRLPAHLHRRRCRRRGPAADRRRGRRRLSGLVPRRLEHRLHLRPGREQGCPGPQRRIRRPRVGRHPGLMVRGVDQRRNRRLDRRAHHGRGSHRRRGGRSQRPESALHPDRGWPTASAHRRLDQDVLVRDDHRPVPSPGRPHSLRRRGEGRGPPVRGRRAGRPHTKGSRAEEPDSHPRPATPREPGPSSRQTRPPLQATST